MESESRTGAIADLQQRLASTEAKLEQAGKVRRFAADGRRG